MLFRVQFFCWFVVNAQLVGRWFWGARIPSLVCVAMRLFALVWRLLSSFLSCLSVWFLPVGSRYTRILLLAMSSLCSAWLTGFCVLEDWDNVAFVSFGVSLFLSVKALL